MIIFILNKLVYNIEKMTQTMLMHNTESLFIVQGDSQVSKLIQLKYNNQTECRSLGYAYLFIGMFIIAGATVAVRRGCFATILIISILIFLRRSGYWHKHANGKRK